MKMMLRLVDERENKKERKKERGERGVLPNGSALVVSSCLLIL